MYDGLLNFEPLRCAAELSLPWTTRTTSLGTAVLTSLCHEASQLQTQTKHRLRYHVLSISLYPHTSPSNSIRPTHLTGSNCPDPFVDGTARIVRTVSFAGAADGNCPWTGRQILNIMNFCCSAQCLLASITTFEQHIPQTWGASGAKSCYTDRCERPHKIDSYCPPKTSRPTYSGPTAPQPHL